MTLDLFPGDPRFAAVDSCGEAAKGPIRLRSEAREDGVRIAEYTGFPRRGSEQCPRVGFTRDFSASGLCLGVDLGENVGALLRVTVRQPDGSPGHTSIRRVIWCSAERDGRYWIGLELLRGTETCWNADVSAA